MVKNRNNGGAKPFSTQGFRIVSPQGTSLWCKIKEPDYQFNKNGILSTTLVCDPQDELVQIFIEKLEALRDEAYIDTKETLGPKGKGTKVRGVYTEHFDEEGNETGLIEFKFALKNVDLKDKSVKVVDSTRNEIKNIPLVGNGSTIRCISYASPYYMPSNKEVGISLIWEQMQIIKLSKYTPGGIDFDDLEVEGGYKADVDFDDEDTEEDYNPKVKAKDKPRGKKPIEIIYEDDEDDAEGEEEYILPAKDKSKTKPMVSVNNKTKPKHSFKERAKQVEVDEEDDTDF